MLFSAFLVLAYTICSYFIDVYSVAITNETLAVMLPLLLFTVFGLFLFYATRVGDGKPVYRFSLAALVLIVLPGLYIFLAAMFDFFPLHEQLIMNGANMVRIACVALGYGLPYTFVSGFELDYGDGDDAAEDVEDLDEDLSLETEETDEETFVEEEAEKDTPVEAESEEADKEALTADDNEDNITE